jgi:hypothetical protein
MPAVILERLERLTLKDLIHDSMFEAFADYDMFDDSVTCCSRPSRWFLLGPRDAEALFQLQSVLEDAVTTIEAVGGRMGFALVYAKESGRELVFLAAIKDREKGICTLELTRRTGDPLRDLLPVSREANGSFLERLEWGGFRRKIDVEIRGKTKTADTIADISKF